MTGVSQATVSLVLNGRADADVRIAPETRERVLAAIRTTGYVADPVARRLADRHNRILGVFTSEPVFPSGTGDFYHPFLLGIEECAEHLGCDLLLLTSAPVVDGRRRLFHQDNRLRLADGAVLLGRQLDHAELARLLADGLPFVCVGRRRRRAARRRAAWPTRRGRAGGRAERRRRPAVAGCPGGTVDGARRRPARW